jgi:hypothetical protein
VLLLPASDLDARAAQRADSGSSSRRRRSASSWESAQRRRQRRVVAALRAPAGAVGPRGAVGLAGPAGPQGLPGETAQEQISYASDECSAPDPACRQCGSRMALPEGTYRLEGHITAFARNAPAQGDLDPVCRYEEPSGTSLRLVIMAPRYDDAAAVGHLEFVTGLTHLGGNFGISAASWGARRPSTSTWSPPRSPQPPTRSCSDGR